MGAETNFEEIKSLLYYFSPFFILLLASILVATANLLRRFKIAKAISYSSMLLSLFISIYFLYLNINVLLYNGLVASDRFSFISWIAMIIGGLVTLAAMSENIARREAQPLLLISLASSLMVVSARDLLILFIAIESSLFPAYALVAQFKREYFSLEATVKFFIFGILATLLFAYGLAMIYNATGSTSFASINQYILSPDARLNVHVLILGFLLLLSSLAIKATLVPLHSWAIDTYQGSPTSISSFLSSSSKIVGIAAIALIISAPFKHLYSLEPIVRYILATLALATMILPNIAALVQRNIKRLLAYSSVAHAGYMALVFVFPEPTLPILGYYLITYSIAKAVSFLVVAKLTGEGSESPYDSLIGFFKKSPLGASTFVVSLLSLAGIPPFAGFMAKFLLFLNVAFSGNLGLFLALVALIMSAVSVYYYAYLIRLETYSNQSSSREMRSLESDSVFLLSIISLIALTFYPSYFYLTTPLF